MFRHLLVAVDGSPNAAHALTRACEIAQRAGAHLDIVVVQPPATVYASAIIAPAPPPRVDAEEAAWAKELLDRSVVAATAAGVRGVTGHTLVAHVVDGILEVAGKVGADLIVLGARGLGPGARLLLGSASDGVVHHARCAVLVDKLEVAGPG